MIKHRVKVTFFGHPAECATCQYSDEYRVMNGLWTADCRKPGGHPHCPLSKNGLETLQAGSDGKLHRKSAGMRSGDDMKQMGGR